jgi:hypothetical protein
MVRDLEKARLIIKEGVGLDLTYAYDDLVFSEHGVLILQFDDKNEGRLLCYFHEDCTEADRVRMVAGLMEAGKNKGCDIETRGRFFLEQKGSEFEIHFK